MALMFAALALPVAVLAAATPAKRAPDCIVTEYAQLSEAVESCSDLTLLDFSAPASSTIDLQSLQTGATVTFAGKTTFGTTPDDDFDPIVLGGRDITVKGAPGNVIDGNGQAYWDGQGSNGGRPKPDHFWVIKHAYNATVSGLNIQNWPTHCFYINACNDLTMEDVNLDNSAGDAPNELSGDLAAAHNADGFDVSGCDTVTLRNTRVHNQDDCVAVTSGSNILVDNFYCYGSHGLSIGSVGGKSNNTVDGVTFQNSVIEDSQNGCRIKTNSETTGSVNDVTYKNITLSGITDYGIDVQQDYLNGGPTGDPTNGVSISNIQFIDVTGTVEGDARDYYILCGDGSCSNISFENVHVTGGSDDSCNFPASGCPS